MPFKGKGWGRGGGLFCPRCLLPVCVRWLVPGRSGFPRSSWFWPGVGLLEAQVFPSAWRTGLSRGSLCFEPRSFLRPIADVRVVSRGTWKKPLPTPPTSRPSEILGRAAVVRCLACLLRSRVLDASGARIVCRLFVVVLVGAVCVLVLF